MRRNAAIITLPINLHQPDEIARVFAVLKIKPRARLKVWSRGKAIINAVRYIDSAKANREANRRSAAQGRNVHHGRMWADDSLTGRIYFT
jgi:hypothetical protein